MPDHSVRADACAAPQAVLRDSPHAAIAQLDRASVYVTGVRCPPGPSEPATTARFWSFVDRSAGPLSCWPWTGGRDDDGYGRFCVDKSERPCVRTNRYALEVAGREPFPWEDAAHKCDNPPCCNPAHLEPLSHRENMRQMAARGRKRGGRIAATSQLLAGRGPGGMS